MRGESQPECSADLFLLERAARYNRIVSFRTVPHLTAIRCATRQSRTLADRSTYLEAPRVSSRPSFQKRQKEQARKEKRRLKEERKQQRKLERDTPLPDTPELAPTAPREGQDS